MFFRRGVDDRPGPWLTARLWVFTIGAFLALIGMATETTWLIAVAAVVLAAGILIRFLPAPGTRGEDPGAEGGGPGDSDSPEPD